MKKIEELKRYYLDHKNVFENSTFYSCEERSRIIFLII